MGTPFDPRKVLKHISNPLLRQFFVGHRNELRDVPWDDLTEHKIEPVFEAWQELPEQQKLEIQIILRDIHTLADHRGVAVLAEEILWRCPDLAEEFKAQVSKQDKAMWVYLNHPAAFDEAAMFARAWWIASSVGGRGRWRTVIGCDSPEPARFARVHHQSLATLTATVSSMVRICSSSSAHGESVMIPMIAPPTSTMMALWTALTC